MGILGLAAMAVLMPPTPSECTRGVAGHANDAPGAADAFALIHVNNTERPGFQIAGLFLVAEVPDGYLAFLDDHELVRLEAAGIPVDVLAEGDDRSLEYLIAYERRHAPDYAHAAPHPAVRSLYQGDQYRIMAVPADLLEAQPDVSTDCVTEIQRVYRRPLRFVQSPWTEPPLAERAVVLDPAIVAAIANITQAPLQNQVQTLQDFVTRHSMYPEGHQASLWIRDQFLSYGYTDVTLHDYNAWNDNVVCVKPGAVFPDQVVVIGAHYDSINPSDNSDAPGADDDASGCVGVLETARVLAGVEFERTMIFICFSGEEQGLVGSEAWVAEAVQSGTDIIGMLCLDEISYRDPGDAEDLEIITYSASDPMANLAHEAIAAYVPELATVTHLRNPFGFSDHNRFWNGGFRALWFLEDDVYYTPYAHSSDDVVGLSANDFPFMLKNVKASAAFMGVFARPYRVVLTHTPLDHSEDEGPFPATATIVSAEPLDASSLELMYRVNGGDFSNLPLSPTGGPDEYGADIPAQGPGDLVEYYLTASDELGFTATSPENAPADLYDFRADVSLVFVDDCEADLGWDLGVAGDDATGGIWIRADPVGTVYQSEDDHTPDPGNVCFVTGNGLPGGLPGDADVDGGRTTVESPVFDLAGFTWASLSYWRWYANEDSPYDSFRVRISNDGGASFQLLEIVEGSAFPWVEVEFDDLGSIIPLTSQMMLRFVAKDTGSASLVEALVDDISVIGLPGGVSAIEEVPAIAARLEVHPNPVTPKTRFNFSIPAAGWIELAVYDDTGALVARPLASELPAGNHSLDFVGSGLPSGVYFARLSQDNRELKTVKLTLVR